MEEIGKDYKQQNWKICLESWLWSFRENWLDISEIIDIFTNEDMENTPLESRM